MPDKNGTGPNGEGPKTGRGFGSCGGDAKKSERRGRGLGLRRNMVDNEKRNEENK